MDKPSKHRLYELYWGEQKDFAEIADEYDVRCETVGEWVRAYGIPYQSNHNRTAFIFARRSRRYYYELYWGKRLNCAEIARRHDLGMNFITEQLSAAGVPKRNGFLPAGDPDEIPPQYEWPDEKPVAPATDDPTADLPENPDGSKYLADGDPEYDKSRLYELYWGYGLAFEHVAARLNIAPATLRDRFNARGIPRREWAAHKGWEPHHGVPPKYEWPHGHDVDEDEEQSIQNGIWRKPTANAD